METFGFQIGRLAAMPDWERVKLMPRRRGGDDAEDQLTGADGESIPQGQGVAVLPPEPEQIPRSESKRRRVQRREELPFTQEERLAIEGEIIDANTSMREVETTKKAQDKEWNGQIAAYEATMNDAVDVLKKGTFTVEVERIEEMNYDTGQVIYFDTDTGQEIDSRDMTEDEKQTRMDM